MTTKEIEAIFNEKIAILKQYDNKPLRTLNDKILQPYDPYKERQKIPPLNPIYRKTVEYRDMIKVHSDIDNKPIDLLRKRAPNEDDRQYLYRVQNFENVTMPSFMKALGKLNRIFNPSNYSIQWTQEQEEQKNYFDSGIPTFESWVSYFEEIVLTQKILDPNALLVVKPYFIPTKEAYDEKGNPILLYDDSKQISPVSCVVECDDVIDYKESVYALIETEEKSEVLVGGKKKAEGLVFEFYDKDNIYRIYQYGKKQDWTFTVPEIYYPHNLGYLPCWKLKGIPQQKDLQVLYQSYFIYAIPNLNLALYGSSNLDMSLTTHMFPQKVEWVDRCYAEGCDNGYINFEQSPGNYIRKTCPACNGTGRLSKTGPQMTKQFVVPDQQQGDTDINSVPFPGVAFVGPDPNIPKFVKEYIDSLVDDAFMFLNMDVSNSDVKGSNTALGKQIDREELFAMLMRISNEIFGLLSKSMKAAGQMRFGKDFKEPVVSAPTSFSIRSEKDLLEELTEAKLAGVPDVSLTEIVKEYISKRYSSRAQIHKIVNLAFAVDRLIVKIQIECDAMLASGTTSKLEVVLHDSIFMYIDKLTLEDPEFWTKDITVQSEALWTMAQETLDKIEASNPGNPNTILQIANTLDKKVTTGVVS